MISYPDPYHRHPDGSLDIDRYRAKAAALRRLAMQDTSKLTVMLKAVAAVVLLLAAIAMAPVRNDGSGTQAADNAATANSATRSARIESPERTPVN